MNGKIKLEDLKINKKTAGPLAYVASGLAIAIAAAVLALMPSCGGESAAVDGEVSVVAQSLSAGGQLFGSTSQGWNYDCYGTICTCDGSADCKKLFNSSWCGGKDLLCEYSDILKRSICSCVIGPQSCRPLPGEPPPLDPNHCPIASLASFPKSGVWFYDDSWHMRLTENDRTCTLTYAQCPNGSACQSGAVNATGDMLRRLRATEAYGQLCSNVEAGLMTNNHADGYYRSLEGHAYKKIGKRVCYADPAFYAKDGSQQTFTFPSSAWGADFWIRYVNPTIIAPACNDYDLKVF